MSKPRVKILFKVGGEVVAEQDTDLFLNQIDEFKWTIAKELECTYDDVEMERIELPLDLSDYDVTAEGQLVDWRDPNTYFDDLVGIKRNVTTDTLMEAISNGTVSEVLHFTYKKKVFNK